jgi:hypothetical protein
LMFVKSYKHQKSFQCFKKVLVFYHFLFFCRKKRKHIFFLQKKENASFKFFSFFEFFQFWKLCSQNE